MAVTVSNSPQPDYSPRCTKVGTGVAGDEVQHMQLVASGATVAAPGQSPTVVTLLAANVNRIGFLIRNEPQDLLADLFVKFGAGATTDDYTEKIPPGGKWEKLGGYTGIITGIWSAAGTGKARVTEETL